MEGDHIKIHHWLRPLAFLFGVGVWVRNQLFDCGILRSRSFAVPVIDIGNLTVGGTGKTPHTEYLIRLLKHKYNVAVLSRGYKRKSKGYILSTTDTPMERIGDEPYQIKQKFPEIHVAVDRDRCHGIEQLMKAEVQPPVDVILLDDAFQHRYVKPDVNILLMDYHRLTYFDKLLPAGRLREHKSGIIRADIIIVTKCPNYITPMDMRGIELSLKLHSWQKIYFTRYRYPEHIPGIDDSPLLVTGIASPEQMVYDLQRSCGIKDIDIMPFPDHHAFSKADIEAIRERAGSRPILTTEKDATRIHGINVTTIPIEVEFIGNDKQEDFNKTILSYVHKNSRNSILVERTNAH